MLRHRLGFNDSSIGILHSHQILNGFPIEQIVKVSCCGLCGECRQRQCSIQPFMYLIGLICFHVILVASRKPSLIHCYSVRPQLFSASASHKQSYKPLVSYNEPLFSVESSASARPDTTGRNMPYTNMPYTLLHIIAEIAMLDCF